MIDPFEIHSSARGLEANVRAMIYHYDTARSATVTILPHRPIELRVCAAGDDSCLQ
jgi:hypothetical protein